jgi:hypothetical protein
MTTVTEVVAIAHGAASAVDASRVGKTSLIAVAERAFVKMLLK